MSRLTAILLFSGMALAAAPSGNILEESWDNGPGKWDFHGNVSIGRSDGYNGSPGLILTGFDEKRESPAAFRLVDLKRGTNYRAEFRYRAENIVFSEENRRRGGYLGVFGVDYTGNNGKWVGGCYAPVKDLHPDGKWHTVTFDIRTQPLPYAKATIRLFLAAGNRGTLYVDELSVCDAGAAEQVKVHIVSRNGLSFDEKLKFVAKTIILSDRVKAEELTMKAISPSGNAAGVKSGDGEFAFDLGEVKPDRIPVTLQVFDRNTGKKLGEHTFCFSRRPLGSGNLVRLAPDGHFTLNGKPFLPVGCFMTYADDTPEALGRVRDAGFNCIMLYRTPASSLRRKISHFNSECTIPELREALDQIHRHGLMVFFDLQPFYPFSKTRIKSMDKIGYPEILGYTIKKIQDHPALLGWYLSDELPEERFPETQALREAAAQFDGNHPSLTLTHIDPRLLELAKTGDVIVFDRYPVLRKIDRPNMEELRRFFQIARGTGLPVMIAPQAFNWGAYRRQSADAWRFPTETEIRSMALLGVVNRAAGYLFYSYFPVFGQQEKLWPGSSKSFWPDVAATARLLRELSPFVLEGQDIPVTIVRKTTESVDIRGLKLGEEIRVVVTSAGPNRAEAEINVPGVTGLKSRYGRTKELGNGRYLYSADGINSDLLFRSKTQ